MNLNEILAGMTGSDEDEEELDDLMDELADIEYMLENVSDQLENVKDEDFGKFGISSADVEAAADSVAEMLQAAADAESAIRCAMKTSGDGSTT